MDMFANSRLNSDACAISRQPESTAARRAYLHVIRLDHRVDVHRRFVGLAMIEGEPGSEPPRDRFVAERIVAFGGDAEGRVD